jgi:triacylglycerol lipase
MLTLLVVPAVAVVAIAGVVAGRATGQDPVAAQDEAGPVLVVPGYGGRIASLDPLVAELRSQGRDVVVVAPSGGGTGDLRAQAVRLGDAAARSMRRADARSVDVVGYSAGGVVARLWVQDEGGAAVARRVVSIGSPQHGTDVAALAAEVAGSCPTACEQLAPDSDLLRALNAGDETPGGPEWVTLRSTSDQVVTPTESSRLDGGLDLVVQEFCPGATTSHRQLPGDPVVLAALRTTLLPAQPRIPQDVRC